MKKGGAYSDQQQMQMQHRAEIDYYKTLLTQCNEKLIQSLEAQSWEERGRQPKMDASAKAELEQMLPPSRFADIQRPQQRLPPSPRPSLSDFGL